MRLIDLERYSLITGQDIMDVVGAGASHFNRSGDVTRALTPDEQDAMDAANALAAEQEAEAMAREQAMAQAAMEAERHARASGGHAKIARDGSCRCPKCGTSLKLILAPSPAVSPGKKAGVISMKQSNPPSRSVPLNGDDEIDVFGAAQVLRRPGIVARPALKAGSAGSCLCACPNCGITLCLSIGPAGYDARVVAKQLPDAYAAVARAIHGY